jgi:glycosyltransferase involved in cell wall biosynthesis
MTTKVLLFATHIHSTNGYCLVGHALANELAKRKDVELTYYGFQNFHKNAQHASKRTLPSNVFIYDAFENENPKGLGFGFDQVTEFVTMNKPDVCIIYNDMVVVSTIMDKLKAVPNKKFKIIVYIDQVYLYQKKEFIKRLNEETDVVIAFTPYWQECVVKQGLTKPTEFIRHGFDPFVHYPVPKKLARTFFGLKEEDFIILNLNRNQPRKRWDICLQAFAEVVSRHLSDPIKLLVATSVTGAWNIIEVFERELGKRGISLQEGMKHLILIDNPQQITDEEINVLYNVADIGISTADGEGFGLCSFQQAAIGIPQIVPAIGGYIDFFTQNSAILVQPKMTLYIDSSRDGVGGECQLCDWNDFAEAVDLYYANPELVRAHGQNARKNILENYKWCDIGDKLYKICKNACGHAIQEKTQTIATSDDDISLDDIKGLIESKERKKIIIEETDSEEEEKIIKQKTAGKKKKRVKIDKDDIKHRLREKLKARNENKVENESSDDIDLKSLLELKSKIDLLISKKQ